MNNNNDNNNNNNNNNLNGRKVKDKSIKKIEIISYLIILLCLIGYIVCAIFLK